MISSQKRTYNAIILAAGYGTRLAPVTDEIPKPLIPVGDRTLLENILIGLDKAGVAKFAINTHHLGGKIEQAINNSNWSDRVEIYAEDEILGTGGPLINAKKMLTDCDTFILHNGDILTDLNFKNLIEHHERSGTSITMVMIDGPENMVAVSRKGLVVDILGKLGRESNHKKMTYTGITVFTSEIFKYLPAEVKNCSIITAILAAMRDNPNAVSAFIPNSISPELKSPYPSDSDGSEWENRKITKSPDIYWNDLGTIEKFLDAQHDISNEKTLLPDAEISIPMSMFPLPYPGGSDRMFFRICIGDSKKDSLPLVSGNSVSAPGNKKEKLKSKIIMCASKDSADFERFLLIDRFLDKQKLGVAQIYNSSMKHHVVIMEDLGDDILYNRLQTGISEDEKEKLYRKIIEWLVMFQLKTYDKTYPEGEQDFSADKIGVRSFSFEYLRWETSYFSEKFLIDYCEISRKDIDDLDCEFRKLAERTLSQPQILIHRDFQSQNILMKDGKIRIVDFQGARTGNIAYDLMSLLKDPYIEISKELRTSLIDYYYELFSQSKLTEKIRFSRKEFAKFATTATLQRNMQALGAYSFLGFKKGKKKYLNHIPQGVAYLKNGLHEFQQYNQDCPLPKLTDMIMKAFHFIV